MAPPEDDDALMKSVALQNVHSILLARQRADHEHVDAKVALEQRTAELANSLAMLHATLEATTDGILVTDGGGKVTGFNEKFVDMWQIPRDVLAQGEHRRLLDVTSHQLEGSPHFVARVEVIDASSPAESHDVLELKDGRVIERFSRIQFVDDRNVGRVWSFRDITERRRTVETLQRQAAIIESSQDAVISKTLDGVITSWNAEAHRLFGYTAEEAVGQPITLIVPVELRDEEHEIMGRLRHGERIEHFETIRVAKDGRRIALSLTISPIRDGAGRVIGASKVARDVTDRKRTDDALREADRRKDEFLALLAHELRNPLAPLQNGLQIVRLADADSKAVAQAGIMMERQLGHMVRLVDDLLDVARINQNKMELRRSRVLLSDVMSSAVETARPAIEAAGHELIISAPAELIHLDADLMRLSQVFSNLLTNSAKYTDRAGHIWFGAERRGAEVIVSVRDTGIGIPTDALSRIFDMFSQVDRTIERTAGGLGIGLALVQGLVKVHGGSVIAESPGVGKGSTFTVRLPVVERSERDTPRVGRGTPQPAGRRLLIADDNPDAADSMGMLLELLGNEVCLAHDGIEAVEMAERFQPDVVLMDMGMPRLNGYDATRRIREQPWGREMTIIALTGWGQENDKARSSEAGCDGHLVKPIDLAALEKLLTKLRPARGSVEG
jgi:PAS domain S-box-containing protein